MMNFDDDFNEISMPLIAVQSQNATEARVGPPKPPILQTKEIKSPR